MPRIQYSLDSLKFIRDYLPIHLIQLSQSNITINFTKPSFLIPKKRNTESILKQITFRFLKRRICSSQKKKKLKRINMFSFRKEKDIKRVYLYNRWERHSVARSKRGSNER